MFCHGRSLVEPTFMLTSGGGSEGFSSAPRYPEIQCSGPMTFWYGSVSWDLYTELRIRILLFSLVAFKFPTKKKTFFFKLLLLFSFLCVHLHQSSKITSQKTVETKVFLNFVLITDPDPEGPETYRSESGTLQKSVPVLNFCTIRRKFSPWDRLKRGSEFKFWLAFSGTHRFFEYWRHHRSLRLAVFDIRLW